MAVKANVSVTETDLSVCGCPAQDVYTKVFCKYCSFLKSRFMYGLGIPLLLGHDCMNNVCFDKDENYPITGNEYAKRIQNWNDLNKDLNCEYFKKKWWIFWL